MEPVTYGKVRGAYATVITGVKTKKFAKKSALLASDVNWHPMRPLRKVLIWAILMAAAVVAMAAAAPAAPALRPNIVLVTLDTTRADRMGFLGSERGLTPNLDALARQATVFSRAYAHVPLTSPSHATMLTGTYPQFSHVNYMGDPLDKSLPFLPDILHRNGYRTAAFVGALVLDPRKLAPGFERGFDVYDAGYHRRRPGEDHYQSVERRGQEVVRRAAAWLNKRASGPFFLWVHLYDPHDPYSPLEPYKSRFANNPYDGEIAYTDAVVGKLFSQLKAHGAFDNSLIAVMADHGEAFGEHGENHHGIFLYDETIHVPMLFKLPGRQAAATVDALVGLVDVTPSILQAVHLPVPAAVQGKSLMKFMASGTQAGSQKQSDSDSQRPVYAESRYGHLSFGWSTLKAWRTGKYLYVEAPERELYDLSAYSMATHNIAPESKAIADTISAQVAGFYSSTKSEATAKRNLNPEQTESLHALGYMSSDSGMASDRESEDGPDPKQKIAVANLLYEALVDFENERFAEAVPVLEQVIKMEPNTPTAYLQLGRSYMALRDFQKAISPLQTLVEKKPDEAFARYELGCALVKTGHWDEAAPQFEAAVSQMKTSVMMHFYLALVYERTSRNDDAVTAFEDALRLDPNHFPANLFMGRMLAKQQKAAIALPYLRKAVKLRPDAIDAHRFLSDAYAQLGEQSAANREMNEAERLRAQGASRLGTAPEESVDDHR
jgi:arylsulfatase A-like enzyme/Tfp pilus assembly protein PilF